MARNYEKEYKWQMQKYDQLKAHIDKNLGLQLREKLKKENKTIAGWITENAKKYIKKED